MGIPFRAIVTSPDHNTVMTGGGFLVDQYFVTVGQFATGTEGIQSSANVGREHTGERADGTINVDLPEALFTGLAPGTHFLQVQAKNVDGQLSHLDGSLPGEPFTVPAPIPAAVDIINLEE